MALPLGLMIGGGAALVTGLILGVTVLTAHSDVSTNCPMANNCAPQYVTEASNARTRGYIGDGLGIAGLIAGGVGVVLLVTGSNHASSSPHVSAACAPGGCAGSVSVAF
jgi:hypothetical protein